MIMKLTPRIIVKKLKERFPIKHSNDLPSDLYLGRPVFYTGAEQDLNHQLFIMIEAFLETEIIHFPATSFIVFVGKRHDTIPKKLNNICVVDCGVDATAVFNAIQNVCNFYDNWYEELLLMRMQEAPIDKILEISEPIFRQRPQVIETDANFDSVRNRDSVFVFTPKQSAHPALCFNIKRHGLVTHHLMLCDPSVRIDESDAFLLEILGSVVKHTLAQARIQQPKRNKDLITVLRTILTDRTADYVSTSQKLDDLGWYSTNEFLCVVFQESSPSRKRMSENDISNYIENVLPHTCAFSHKNRIVIFVNITKAQLTLENISERLLYFVRDSHFKAGYSRVMEGHFNLRRQYLQALIALDLGDRKMPSMWSHDFNDVVFDYILEQATRRLPGYMLSHEKLLHLKEMDDFQNTDYMHTLKLYLDNHLNAVKTAKDLYIHRSTFLYRLDKIKSILDTNLEDPEEILYLMLSFRFIEMEDSKPTM